MPYWHMEQMQTAKVTWNYSNFPDSADSKGNLVPNGVQHPMVLALS